MIFFPLMNLKILVIKNDNYFQKSSDMFGTRLKNTQNSSMLSITRLFGTFLRQMLINWICLNLSTIRLKILRSHRVSPETIED